MPDQEREMSVAATVEPVLHPAARGEAPPPTAVDAASAEFAAADRPAIEIVQPAFVYALGQIEPRFPSLGVEKEYAQVIARRADTDGVIDRQLLVETLAEPQNRYLARQMCWCFVVEGLDTYILLPRDPGDFELLIGAVREYPGREDVDILIGTRGGIAPPEMCNGLAAPIVVFDQIYSFDRESLVRSIPVPASIAENDRTRFQQTAGSFFDHVMKLADNAGATDEHRALNYVASRYSQIYTTLAEQQDENASLAGVDVRLSALSGARNIVDVILSFTHRQTGVTSKHYLQVDVTEEWPFLMTPLSPYYDRG